MSVALHRRRSAIGLLFVAPWLIGFAAFLAAPLARSLIMSFADVNSISLQMRFVGLSNYTKGFLDDAEFLPIYWETARNALIDTPIIVFFSLVIAIVLDRKIPAKALFRAVFFLPVVISSGYVIEELFGQGVGGIASAIGVGGGGGAGGQALESTAAQLTAKTPAIINVSAYLREFLGPEVAQGVSDFLNRLGLVLWRSGIQVLLFLAGLQGISSFLYDAARIDGANEWELFWKVTLPVISPIIVAVVVFTIIDSFMDVFNKVLDYIHRVSFTRAGGFDYGYGAALSWIYFITVFALILLTVVAIRKRLFYQGVR